MLLECLKLYVTNTDEILPELIQARVKHAARSSTDFFILF
jgi:hypothetical protein